MSVPGREFAKSLLKRAVTIIFTWNIVLLCIVGTFIVLAILGAAMATSDPEATSAYAPIYGEGEQQLLSIRVQGVITGTDTAAPSFFSSMDTQTAGYTVKDQLYAAAKDDLIEGVILEIDSPGGTIFGAHAIADGVEYYRSKTKKPVYAHISGTGASGAYWAAVSTDKVLVDYGSDVGSIGVILGPFQYYNKVLSENAGLLGGGVITENGIESTILTAGKSKDVGNPYRRLAPEEVAALQKTVNNEYDAFVAYVSQRRNIPGDSIRNQIGALTYDSRSALEQKLADKVANRHDAYDLLAEAARVKDNYQVVQEQYLPGFVESLVSAVTRKPQPKVQGVNLCNLTRVSLAYHGDVTGWCQK